MTGVLVVASGLALAVTAVHSQCPVPSPLEVVASISTPDFSGVVVTADQRIFLGFPRHAEDHAGPTLAEYRNGRLIPYPDASMSLPGEQDPAKRLVSVHGMTLDSAGTLWLIDDGKEAGKPIQPGAVKVVGIDVSRNRVIASVQIPLGAYLPDSHMNDLRVDLTHGAGGTAFITDSSFGDSPALVVVDLATGTSRRIFEHSRFTAADTHFMTYLEGKPLIYSNRTPRFPQGGADGIELSIDSTRLYWTSLSGRELWSAPTNVLSDGEATPQQLEDAVTDEGERPNADGLARDDAGGIYFGAYDQRSLIRRSPDGSFCVVAHDDRLGWPDALFVQNGYLYVTLGQWNRLAGFNNGVEKRRPPYLLVRVRLPDNTQRLNRAR
jgi:sugar lactone lactonase YvrE